MRLMKVIILVAGLRLMTGCSNEGKSTDIGTDLSFEARRQLMIDQEMYMSEEGQKRKERSIRILEAEQVPLLESLPLIETEAESIRRTTEQVAERAMVLCIVAVKGEGLEQEKVEELIHGFQIESAFMPEEQAFIANPHPTSHERIQFSWRYEGFWVMLWALGFVNQLERPDQLCDVQFAVSFLANGPDYFLQKANLRSQGEILDAADLIYRYHWAVVDARINNRDAPAGLDGGVVMERHHALNWLIGYMNQEWDDITTDT